MPGICGIIDTGTASELQSRLEGMLRCLRQHSWQREESYVCDTHQAALGRVSLGFINTEPQPYASTEGRYVAVLDGEIYVDAKEQRAGSQVAHFLDRYLREGSGFLQTLHGSFSAAIWDRHHRRVIIVNDHFATRPLYYTQQADKLLFASCIKSLTIDQDVGLTPNATGIAQFFTFGHYLRNDTALEAIQVLPPASVLTFDLASSKATVTSYTPLPASAAEQTQRSDSAWLEAIDTCFKQAVDRRTQATPHLGLALSGGLDARTILGVMEPGLPDLKTICLGMAGSLDHQSAAKLAALYGCQHENHVLDTHFLGNFEQHLQRMVQLTDGQYLSQCIVMPTLPVYERLGIQVLLRGHAGELMHMRKAYNYSLDEEALQIRTNEQLRNWLLKRLRAYMIDGVERPLFRGELAQNLDQLAIESLDADLTEADSGEAPIQRIWSLFVRQRLRRETVLSLMKFRSVVEPRLPYLDHELIKLLLAAPTGLKLGEEIQTHILTKRRPDFLRVLNANTGAPMGASLFRQKIATVQMKILGKLGVPGYQPYERLGLWLRRELAPTVKKVLLSDSSLENGIFDPDGIRSVVKNHLENRQNHTFLIMALMIFHLGRQWLAGRGEAEQIALPATVN